VETRVFEIRAVRAGVLVGLVAFLYQLWRYFMENVGTTGEGGPPEDLPSWKFLALLGAIILGMLFVSAWFVLPLVFHGLSFVTHRLFGGQATILQWHEATARGLRVLPFAAAAGVITWIIYDSFRFGGWSDDLVFGVIGNGIGAVASVALFWSWVHARKNSETRHETSQ